MTTPHLRRYLLFAPGLIGLGLVLDSYSTYLALVSGNASEGNPLVALLVNFSLGLPLFVFFKLLALALAFYITYFMRTYTLWRQLLYAFLLTIIALFFIFTAISNITLASGLGHGFFVL